MTVVEILIVFYQNVILGTAGMYGGFALMPRKKDAGIYGIGAGLLFSAVLFGLTGW